ncbi:hypothetical protein [Noviherbaspirillum malthae]|uniref:hypothetical protein n=1 Tax=Noviherbaspirillum malthae TaxID=1260987 RepID=UPI00188FC492|nr:hypothetical protein [Noviherbaspirillum malthae]
MADHDGSADTEENPFVTGDWAVTWDGNGRLVRQLVQSLAGQGVVCHLEQIRALEPERFMVALHMLEWFYQHGANDKGLNRLAKDIQHGESGHLF